MTRYLEELDVILDYCLTEIQSGRMSVEECLAAYSDYQPDLGSLLNLAHRLSAASEITAAPAFRERALANFHSMAGSSDQGRILPYPVQPVSDPFGKPSNHRAPSKANQNKKTQRPYFSFSLGAAVLILAVLSLFTFSFAFAANQSKPGSAIYPIKIALEDMELRISTTQTGDQWLHLKFAARRLAEVDLLIQDEKSYLIDEAITNYSSHLASAISLLTSSDIQDQERLQIAEAILNSQSINEVNLEVLSQRISPEQRATIIAAIQSAREARDQASQVVDRLPEIRDQIRQILINTLTAPSATPTAQEIAARSIVSASVTPTPSPSVRALPTDDWLVVLPDDLPDWLNSTPDWPYLATQYPTLYPTLASLATRFPDIRSTPRPYVNPTRVRPSQINPTRQWPTIWPTLPIIPTR